MHSVRGRSDTSYSVVDWLGCLEHYQGIFRRPTNTDIHARRTPTLFSWGVYGKKWQNTTPSSYLGPEQRQAKKPNTAASIVDSRLSGSSRLAIPWQTKKDSCRQLGRACDGLGAIYRANGIAQYSLRELVYQQTEFKERELGKSESM